MPEILSEGRFDTAEFAAELAAAPANHHIGSRLIFENERVRVWEVRLQPGERVSFHVHDQPYFWTVADAGVGRQRTADGEYVVRRYEMGDTWFGNFSPEAAMIHDFENFGEGEMRFITVELPDR